MTDTAQRHRANNAVRGNDYVTMEQCVKIAIGVAEKTFAETMERRAQEAHYRVWYRRLWRRIVR